MIRNILKIFIPMLALVVTFGCLNSEKDYELLVNENKSLAEGLQTVETENAILNRALDNIKIEKQSLQKSLDAIHNYNRIAVVANDGARAPLPPAQNVSGNEEADMVGDDYWVEASTPAPAMRPARGGTGGAGKIYITQPNDVLSSIAEKHNTTTARLLELNPQIRNRRDYMIWADDEIVLP